MAIKRHEGMQFMAYTYLNSLVKINTWICPLTTHRWSSLLDPWIGYHFELSYSVTLPLTSKFHLFDHHLLWTPLILWHPFGRKYQFASNAVLDDPWRLLIAGSVTRLTVAQSLMQRTSLNGPYARMIWGISYSSLIHVIPRILLISVCA